MRLNQTVSIVEQSHGGCGLMPILGGECGMWWPVGRLASAKANVKNPREDSGLQWKSQTRSTGHYPAFVVSFVTETLGRTNARGSDWRMRSLKVSEKPYLTLRWYRPGVLCKGRTPGESSHDTAAAQSIVIANDGADRVRSRDSAD